MKLILEIYLVAREFARFIKDPPSGLTDYVRTFRSLSFLFGTARHVS